MLLSPPSRDVTVGFRESRIGMNRRHDGFQAEASLHALHELNKRLPGAVPNHRGPKDFVLSRFGKYFDEAMSGRFANGAVKIVEGIFSKLVRNSQFFRRAFIESDASHLGIREGNP